MKNIVWVDKSVEIIELYSSEFLKNKGYLIISFNDNIKALKYIKKNKNAVDLVIANYCTFFWFSLLSSESQNIQEKSICFYLFDSLSNINSKIPFILFSDIASSDLRTTAYQENEKFHYILKKGELLKRKVDELFLVDTGNKSLPK